MLEDNNHNKSNKQTKFRQFLIFGENRVFYRLFEYFKVLVKEFYSYKLKIPMENSADFIN